MALARVRARTNLMCVAGAPDVRLTASEREVLSDLTEPFEGVLPLAQQSTTDGCWGWRAGRPQEVRCGGGRRPSALG